MATEKRLIDVEEFLKWIVKRFHCVPLVGSCDNDSESIKLLLAQAPTVDAVEVMHGEWLNTKFTTELLCGNCFELTYIPITKSGRKPYNYCPNCGAKMDGGLYEP